MLQLTSPKGPTAMAATVTALAERTGLNTWGNSSENDRLRMKLLRSEGVTIAEIAKRFQLPEQHVRTGTWGFAPKKQAQKPASKAWGDRLLECYPELIKACRGLTKHAEKAQDLAQDTFTRALGSEDKFTEDTNLMGWLAVIATNLHRSSFRKWREVEDPEGIYAATFSVPAQQGHALDLASLIEALNQLPAPMAEALRLVAIQGMQYDEAADVMGCETGTIKSRVHRARTILAERLGIDASDFHTDGITAATLITWG